MATFSTTQGWTSFGTPTLRQVLGIRLPTTAPAPSPVISPPTMPIVMPPQPTSGITIRPVAPMQPAPPTNGNTPTLASMTAQQPGPAGIPPSTGYVYGGDTGQTTSGSSDWLLWAAIAVVAVLALRR